jgi:hypothetical protein
MIESSSITTDFAPLFGSATKELKYIKRYVIIKEK